MAGRELNELEDELAVAAAEERYSAAAALKTRMDTLNERDVAAAVVAQMDELLENEKCAQALLLYMALRYIFLMPVASSRSMLERMHEHVEVRHLSLCWRALQGQTVRIALVHIQPQN